MVVRRRLLHLGRHASSTGSAEGLLVLDARIRGLVVSGLYLAAGSA